MVNLSKINGIGETIQGKLERRLKQYLDKENGQLDEVYPIDLDDWDLIPDDIKKKGVKKPNNSRSAGASGAVPISSLDALSSSQAVSQESSKRKRKTVKKAYVPAYKSGAYGIIMALYKHTQIDCLSDLMTKTELVAAAEQYWDNSVKGQNASYSQWSSSATLIKKELLIKRGNPGKYCLSIEGIELGKQLWDKTNDYERGSASDTSTHHITQVSSSRISISGLSQRASYTQNENNFSSTNSTRLTSSHVNSSVFNHVSLDMKHKTKRQEQVSDIYSDKTATTTSVTKPKSQFQFWYVDSTEKNTLVKDDACIMLDEECAFKIRYHHMYSTHAIMAYVKKDSVFPDKDGMLIGWLKDTDAPEVATGFDAKSTATNSIEICDSDSSDDSFVELSQPGSTATRTNVQKTMVPKSFLKSPESAGSYGIGSERTPWPSNSTASSKIKYDFSKIKPICFKNGSYDIFLVFDSRENRAKTSSKDAIEYFRKENIPFIVRALEVGDMLWIAKSRYNPNDEIVLDFIVERKREDDLVQSIKTGRLAEQKARLKICTLSRIFYLVEHLPNYDADHEFGPLRIEAAITMMQLLDDVYVWQASNGVDDSLRFLRILHDQVLETYRNKDLYAVPPAHLDEDNAASMKLQMQKHFRLDDTLLTYESFCNVTTKSKRMKLRDLWLKQLLCIRGLTVTKAIIIVEKYATPTLLIEKLKSIPTDKERIDFVKNITSESVITRDKIGPALAKSLVDTLLLNEYPPLPAPNE